MHRLLALRHRISRTRRQVLCFVALLSGVIAIAPAPAHALRNDDDAVRIKDLGHISGWRENALVGYGLVTGLAGTGDSSRNKATRQSLVNMLSHFELNLSADDMLSRNAAAVMVTASLSSYAKPGDTMDVTVTSAGDARSLVGGVLVLTPLRGPDGRVYALAQGPVLVGGYKYDVNGNVVQKNHPTTGSVATGATVELAVPVPEAAPPRLTFSLADADFTTASRIAAAVDASIGVRVAHARDASAIDIDVPESERARLADFITRLEGVRIAPDVRARVVINERTGTVVAGGDVRISRVAISQGDLRVSVVTTNTVSQPFPGVLPGADIRTQPYANSRITVEEGGESGFVATGASDTVTDLVQALHKLKTQTRDVISILRAMKSAGALHADLVVQ